MIRDTCDITLADIIIFKKYLIHENQSMKFKIIPFLAKCKIKKKRLENYEAVHAVIISMKFHFKIPLS